VERYFPNVFFVIIRLAAWCSYELCDLNAHLPLGSGIGSWPKHCCINEAQRKWTSE